MIKLFSMIVFVLLIFTIGSEELSSKVNTNDLEVRCEAGDPASCVKLEKGLLKENDFNFLRFSMRSCSLGVEVSCEFIKTLIYDSLLKIILFILVFVLVVKYRIRQNDLIALFGVKLLLLFFLLFYLLRPVTHLLLSFLFVDLVPIEASVYSMILKLLVVIFIIKFYKFKLNTTPFFVKSTRNIFISFIGVSSLYTLVILFIASVFKEHAPPSESLSSLDLFQNVLIATRGVFVSPLYEELLFKGLLLNILIFYLGPKKWAIIMPLALFLILHNNFMRVILLSGISVLSFMFYFYFRNIAVVVIAHCCNNLIVHLAFQFDFVRSYLINRVNNDAFIYPFWLFLLFLGALLLLSYYLIREYFKYKQGWELKTTN